MISSWIGKFKIAGAVLTTCIVLLGLYTEGKAQWFDYLGASIMVPFSILIWNRTLYDAMQRERPFKMSYQTFERLSLLAPILLLYTSIGLLIS